VQASSALYSAPLDETEDSAPLDGTAASAAISEVDTATGDTSSTLLPTVPHAPAAAAAAAAPLSRADRSVLLDVATRNPLVHMPHALPGVLALSLEADGVATGAGRSDASAAFNPLFEEVEGGQEGGLEGGLEGGRSGSPTERGARRAHVVLQ
jgi:hypothetical protein